MTAGPPTPPLLAWTVRLLAGTCLFGAWIYIGHAIGTQSPDEYWLGVALAGEAAGLLRRLNWARTFGLLGLAYVAALGFWEMTRDDATVGSVAVLAAALVAAFFLARHPQHFERRWW